MNRHILLVTIADEATVMAATIIVALTAYGLYRAGRAIAGRAAYRQWDHGTAGTGPAPLHAGDIEAAPQPQPGSETDWLYHLYPDAPRWEDQ